MITARKKSQKPVEELPNAAQRRDEALRRALGMAPRPKIRKKRPQKGSKPK